MTGFALACLRACVLAETEDKSEIIRELAQFASTEFAKYANMPASTSSLRVVVYINDEETASKRLVEKYNVKLQFILLRAVRDASPDFLLENPVRANCVFMRVASACASRRGCEWRDAVGHHRACAAHPCAYVCLHALAATGQVARGP